MSALRKWLLIAAMVVCVFLAVGWAWRAADGSFANLWLTPDQRGDRLMARQQYAEAAAAYRDPFRQAVALYRAGEFKQAAAEFGRSDTAEGAFNRGNAMVMTGKYTDAIAAYDRALKLRPDWQAAASNRRLAEARRRLLSPPEGDDEGTGGQLRPDAIVFDNRPGPPQSDHNTETTAGGAMTDSEIQALWLRRVQTKPADFLRAKFAYQLSRRQPEPTP